MTDEGNGTSAQIKDLENRLETYHQVSEVRLEGVEKNVSMTVEHHKQQLAQETQALRQQVESKLKIVGGIAGFGVPIALVMFLFMAYSAIQEVVDDMAQTYDFTSELERIAQERIEAEVGEERISALLRDTDYLDVAVQKILVSDEFRDQEAFNTALNASVDAAIRSKSLVLRRFMWI